MCSLIKQVQMRYIIYVIDVRSVLYFVRIIPVQYGEA